jgi:phage tail protein X
MAGRRYVTKTGDMLDLICWRHYKGIQSGAVEAVLAANRGLADQPPVLPPGLSIALPDLPTMKTTATVSLW